MILPIQMLDGNMLQLSSHNDIKIPILIPWPFQNNFVKKAKLE